MEPISLENLRGELEALLQKRGVRGVSGTA